MEIFLKVIVQLTLVLSVFGVFSLGKPNWSYDFTNIEIESLTPDICNASLYVARVSRGVYAISGEVDIKQDLTDDLHIQIDVFMSPTGSKNSYVRTPFRVEKCTLSEYGRKYYKDQFMESMKKCSENAWLFGDKVEVPLTKRVMKINNCVISNDNMISHVKSGYYRLVFRYMNQAQGSVTIDSHVIADV